MDIHPTAIVSPSAELGQGTRVGPFCVIGPRVRLGANCNLWSHVAIHGETVLGDDCEIFPFAVLGTTPQDKKVDGSSGNRLVIGSRNRIREHVTIHGGTPFGLGVTTVGDDNMLLVGSHIGHDAQVGSQVIFTNGAMAAGHTVIQDRAVLGAMVGVHQFGRVGRLAMVGAGAMLSRDAPPFSLVQGDRARVVGVNVVGLKRQGVPTDDVAAIKRAFRQLLWRSGTLADRVAAVRERFGEHPSVREILTFVADSRRGVCRPRGRFDGGAERDSVED